ncbi:MAG TPA: nucleotide pyrophosphohydrolase [Armatimonadetes bacterium]|nr:nucleotide pyrophosphohydrolase [Armatimonadota bacterium]
MTIEQFQRTIEETYGERDAARGLERTFIWFVEEVGELARALRSESHERKVEEFSDVLAWLTTTASLAGVEMSEAAERFARGCPKCDRSPCECRREGREKDSSPRR